MIIARAPLRVSFIGGGTDHPDWFMHYGPGAVISTTINKYVYVQLRRLSNIFPFRYRVAWRMLETVATVEEIQNSIVRGVMSNWRDEDNECCEVIYNADLPARSGLGSSSSFAVAMLQARFASLNNYISTKELARQAIRLEQDILHEPVGCQDQIAAAYGGLNRIDFASDGNFTVRPLAVPARRLSEFQSCLSLWFTGLTRSASDIESKKKSSFANRQVELRALVDSVSQGVELLENNNRSLDEFGHLLHEGWLIKRSLSKAVSTSEIDEAYARALDAGALGGKLLGAGGGGFLLLYSHPDAQARIAEANPSLVHVPFKFEREGCRMILYEQEFGG